MIESENVINIETSGGRIGMISNIISYQISESTAETVYIMGFDLCQKSIVE
jgi:hypothetical protein